MKKAPRLGLARKYRPQLFEDVVGQEAVATTLKNAVESGQTAHAYLFFGPKGVGKTTSARILAKALNCKDGPTPTPCGKCPSCEEIAKGASIDVLELDAASNTQVDKIREMIIETVSLAPSRDRSKIFIIDEVHMLSASSFNALLKTLEEPPAHVVFILATTEQAKIPATIVSRCQRFRFRPVPREAIAAHLGSLAKQEKISAEEKALDVLARAAGGSLRDAVSLFDQAAAYGDGAVTEAGVTELMGTLPEEFLLGIVSAVLAKDAAALSSWLDRVVSEGYDPGQLNRDLRDRMHGLYLQRLGAASGLVGAWKELAGAHSPETFAFLVKRVNRTLEELRSADSPQLTFELGLYGMIEAAYDLGQLVARLEALEKRLGGAPGPAPRASVPVPSVSAGPVPAPAPAPRPAGGVWPAVLERLAQKKPMLSAGLKECRLVEAEDGPWRLYFKQTFSLERAQTSKAEIEAELKGAAGRDIRLSLELEPKAAAPAPAEPKEKARPAEGWVDSAAGPEPGEDPGIKKVLGVLGGRVKQVKKPSKG